MKKQRLVVLAAAATILIGLSSLVLVHGSEIVAAVPGNTVVQDPEGDFLLRNCSAATPGMPCSLPPNASPDLPGYLDIKTAKITEIGRGRVELFIALYEPIPETPPYSFISYFWQFEGGCVVGGVGNKSGVQVVWRNNEWHANWFVITKCSPRESDTGGSIGDFRFTEDGVKVRVALDDLAEAIDPGEPLIWHAGVRRVPFIYTLNGGPITRTVAVDYAPDVLDFNTTPPIPPYFIYPEDPATWEPR